MPVNALNFCYGSCRPVTVCVKDVSHLREYAQQNHIFFIRTVSKAWPSVLVLEWWANKIIRNKTESACPYVQYGSNGSNLHVEQNQFITILRNLQLLSLVTSQFISPLRNNCVKSETLAKRTRILQVVDCLIIY